MVKIRQAVILAGGLGTRLRPLTDDCPKPLLEVEGQPFIDRLIEQFKDQGIEEVVLLTGYLSEKIEAHVGDGTRYGISVKISKGEVEFETGKRLKHAEALLAEHFLLLYGDNYWEALDLNALTDFYNEKGRRASVCVFDNHLNTTTNNCLVKDGQVMAYDKSRQNPKVNGVEIGFFILEKSIVEAMPDENLSFEKTAMGALVEEGQLAGFMTDQRYYSIGNHDTYYDLCRYLRSKKTVFLDRDGVINEKAAERGTYISKPEQFRFRPGSLEGIVALKRKGYRVIVITNQAGIGRGVYTEADLQAVHERMNAELKQHGVELDAIYHCPHDWNDNCGCRKPGPGMMHRAALEFDLSLRHTTFLGDDRRDMMLGHNVGCRTILVRPDDRLDDWVGTL